MAKIKEPEFDKNLSQADSEKFAANSLQFYKDNFSPEDASIWLAEFGEKMGVLVSQSQIDKIKHSHVTPMWGFFARMSNNGANLSSTTKGRILAELTRIQSIKNKKQTIGGDYSHLEKARAARQNNLNKKASEIIGMFEEAIDKCISNGFTDFRPIDDVKFPEDVSKASLERVAVWFNKEKSLQFDLPEEELKELYKHLTKPQLNKWKQAFDLILSKLGKISVSKIVPKKPRKPRASKKSNDPNYIIRNVKYSKEYKSPEFNLTSANPKSIIGAEQVWLYDFAYGKLHRINAVSGGKLSIKGTTIINFDEKTSITKKLRKPKGVIKSVLTDGKVQLRKVMESLTTTEYVSTGRLSENVVILRCL